MPLRRCVIRHPSDKSDRIDIQTCYVFHYVAVPSSDIFETAVSIALHWSIAPNFSTNLFLFTKLKQLVRKYPMMAQRRSQTYSTSLCQYDQICPEMEQLTRNLCILIRFVLLAISFLQCNLICRDGDFWYIGAVKRLACFYALRYDLSNNGQ